MKVSARLTRSFMRIKKKRRYGYILVKKFLNCFFTKPRLKFGPLNFQVAKATQEHKEAKDACKRLNVMREDAAVFQESLQERRHKQWQVRFQFVELFMAVKEKSYEELEKCCHKYKLFHIATTSVAHLFKLLWGLGSSFCFSFRNLWMYSKSNWRKLKLSVWLKGRRKGCKEGKPRKLKPGRKKLQG